MEKKFQIATPDYYDKGDIETIHKMERVALELSGMGLNPVAICDVFMALKYFDRMGSKKGESFYKDAGKCADYIYRAIEGTWPGKR